MKKPLLIVVIILAVILVLPVISFLSWTFQPKKPLGIILVDKTVPTLVREKHKSFNWIITNNRFVKYVTVVDTIKTKNATPNSINVEVTHKKRGSYSFRKDYFGFVPLRPLRDRLYKGNDYRLTEVLGDLSRNNDAVFFTDTYGVFFNDWYQGINKSRKSRKLYGGTNSNDNVLFKTMQESNKLVLMEYNTFDYPTDEYIALRIEEKLGITFTGWTGKYFHSLDTAAKGNEGFPIWMTAMYRKQYKKPWTFNKPGVVFLKDKYILVFDEGNMVKNPMPKIITDSAYCAKYNLSNSVSFDQWFDIIDPLNSNVISKYKIETTALGDSILAEYGLLNEFPAVIQEPLKQRTFYFSGDFTYKNIPMWTCRFKGFDKLKVFLYSNNPDDTRRFFWLYYKPLIEGIFNDYYNSLEKK